MAGPSVQGLTATTQVSAGCAFMGRIHFLVAVGLVASAGLAISCMHV